MRWRTKPPTPPTNTHTFFALTPHKARDGYTYWLCRLQAERYWQLGGYAGDGYWCYTNVRRYGEPK